MSFLTSQPNLSGTIYADINLDEPRAYLHSQIMQADATWLDNPQGLMGEYWHKDDTEATCNLIWIASMLHKIASNISDEDIPALQSKLKSLLSSRSEAQFLQNRAELEVGSAFVHRGFSLTVEPLAFEQVGAETANPAPSPDFAFAVPEGRVYLEVTVFSVGMLDKWQKAVDHIIATLQKRLFKQGRSLKLYLQLPLQELDTNLLTERAWNKIKLRSSDSGTLTLMEKGTIRWEPYLVTMEPENGSPLSSGGVSTPAVHPTSDGGWEILFRFKTPSEHETGFITFSPSGLSYAPTSPVDHVSFVPEPTIAVLSEKDIQAANGMVFNALKNKLEDKRKQFSQRHKYPYLLVIKPGHYRLQGNGLVTMIEREIWRKPDYKWMTGIILFTSRNEFRSKAKGAGGHLLFSFNPDTDCQISDSLTAVIDRTA